MSLDANQRLRNALDKLRSETAFADQFSEPATLRQRMAERHTPAISIAVIDDHQIAAQAAVGTCEADVSCPVDTDTLFLAGSISKSVFATAVMYLVQTGRIDLDEDINHYLTSWKIPSNSGWQARVTLRQILSHTAGLTVHGFPGYQTTEALPALSQVLNGERPANTARVEVNILPGMQFRYSGGGTTVAQQALIDCLQESFPALMKRLVLDPLGMHNSTFENPLPEHTLPRTAVAHPWKGIPLRGKHHVYPEAAAAGLWTTAEDLATFGLALQKSLRGDKHTLLTKDTIETMLSAQLPQETDSSDYAGLGFFCEGADECAVFRHGGWDEGFVAELKLYRRSGRGAVVMINSNEGFPLIDEVMRAISAEFGWPEHNEAPSGKGVSELHEFVGQYCSEHDQVFSIELTEGGVVLQLSDQPPVPFESSAELCFSSRVLNTRLTFERDSEGLVSQLSVQQDHHTVRATRVAI